MGMQQISFPLFCFKLKLVAISRKVLPRFFLAGGGDLLFLFSFGESSCFRFVL